MRKLAVILSLVILAIASNVGGHPDSKAELIVNGRKHTATILSDDMTTVSYLVTLQKGTNVITFGNPAETISVVDCMALEKVN